MDRRDRNLYSEDLGWVAERLEQDRPAATPLELDRIKLAARSRAAGRAGSRMKGSILKSRLAITAILVTGLVMSSGGATLALSGDSGDGSASVAQYGTTTGTTGGTTTGGTTTGTEAPG